MVMAMGNLIAMTEQTTANTGQAPDQLRADCQKNFQRILARQPRVLGQIDLTHSARTEQPHDPESGKEITAFQRHGRILRTSTAEQSKKRSQLSAGGVNHFLGDRVQALPAI